MVKCFPGVGYDKRLTKCYRITLQDSSKLESAINEFQHLERVEFTEKIYLVHNNSIEAPAYNSSAAYKWPLKAINFDNAFANNGSNYLLASDVKVGIVDESIDISNPDLINKVDYFYQATTNPSQNTVYSPSCNFNHGTVVAGILGASLGARLYCADAQSASVNLYYEAIPFLIQQGVKIMYTSWDSDGNLPKIYELILQSAEENEVLISAAAGNDYHSIPLNKHYPQCYGNTLVTAALDLNQNTLNSPPFVYYPYAPPPIGGYGTNFGPTVDVCAPSCSLSTSICSQGALLQSNNFGPATSWATPLTTAVLANVKAMSTNLNRQQLINCIKNTASINNITPTSSININTDLGTGMIDMDNAMKCTTAPYITVDGSANLVCAGNVYSISTTINSNLSTYGTASYTVTLTDGVNNSTVTSNVANPTFTLNPGVYDLNVEVQFSNYIKISYFKSKMVSVVGLDALSFSDAINNYNASLMNNTFCNNTLAAIPISVVGYDQLLSLKYQINSGTYNEAFFKNNTDFLYFNTGNYAATVKTLNITEITGTNDKGEYKTCLTSNYAYNFFVENCCQDLITNGDLESVTTINTNYCIDNAGANLNMQGLYTVADNINPSSSVTSWPLYGNYSMDFGKSGVYKSLSGTSANNYACPSSSNISLNPACPSGLFEKVYELSGISLENGQDYFFSIDNANFTYFNSNNSIDNIKLEVVILDNSNIVVQTIMPELFTSTYNSWLRNVIKFNFIGSTATNYKLAIRQYCFPSDMIFFIDNISLRKKSLQSSSLSFAATCPISISSTPNCSTCTYTWLGATATGSNTTTTQVAGNVSVNVTDGSGCTITQSISVQPFNFITQAINQCNTATIIATATPLGTYQYRIDGGIWQNSNTFNSVANGTHTIEAKSSANCIATSTITLEHPFSVTIQAQSHCLPIDKMDAIVSATNAQANTYSYLWSPALKNNAGVNLSATGSTIGMQGTLIQNNMISSTQNLAGIYTCTVTDANGCTETATFELGKGVDVTSITVNPQTWICGQTLTLTPSPNIANATYKWLEMNSNNNPISATYTLSLSPGDSKIVSVSASDHLGCKSANGNANSGVLSAPPFSISLIASNNSPLCGSTITINATANINEPFTYAWTGNTSTTNSLVVLPTSNSVYTVTATGTICNTSSTIAINLTPSTVSITANQNNQCANLSLTASSNLTNNFLWTLPNTTTTNQNPLVISNPQNNSIYTVSTVNTNSLCNVSTTYLSIIPPNNFCCSTTIPANTNYLTNPTNTAFTTLNGGNYYIDGTYTVNGNISFTNCNFWFTPNSKIELANGAVLTMNTCTLQAGCPNLWKGIYSATNSQIIINNCVISDMEDGVVSSAANKLECTNTTFNNNYIALHLNNNVNSNNSIKVQNNSFKSTTNLLAPLQTQKGKIGILSVFSKDIIIGGPSAAHSNTFDGLQCGISIQNFDPNKLNASNIAPYNITSENNIFTNILGGLKVDDIYNLTPNQSIYTDIKGTAIHGRGSRNYKSSLNVLGTKYDALGLNFNYNNKAIITSAISTQVKDVHLGNNSHSGFIFADALNGTYKATDNILNGVVQGIAKFGNEANTIFNLGFEAYENVITLKYGAVNYFGPNYSANAITSYYSPSYNGANAGKSHMSNNTIYIPNHDYLSGVGIVLSSSKTGATIAANSINFTGAILPSGEVPQWNTNIGINLQNSRRFSTRTNNINGTLQAISTARCHGIYMYRNSNYAIECNNISNTQFGLTAIGANPSGNYNKINENSFNTSRAGLLMRHLTVDGWVGNIGEYFNTPSGIKYDANNHFADIASIGSFNRRVWRLSDTTCNTSGGDKITTQLANLTPSQSYITGGLAACKIVIDNQTQFTQIAACNPPPPINPNINDYEYETLIALDAINYYNFEEGARFTDIEQVYKLLEDESTLLTSNATLANFYNNLQNTDLALLSQIDNALSSLYDADAINNPSQWQSLYEDAAQLNQNLEAANILVVNEQWINNILLYLANNSIEQMEASTLDQIKTLAIQCPYIAGDAVYKARNILAPLEVNVRYDDLNICNSQGVYRGGKNTYIAENESIFENSAQPLLNNREAVNIFPNPTNGLLKIDYKINDDGVLAIYDISGRLVRSILLPATTQHIVTDISDLANGIYTYKVRVNSSVISNGKIIKD
jgi:hypothetical protein